MHILSPKTFESNRQMAYVFPKGISKSCAYVLSSCACRYNIQTERRWSGGVHRSTDFLASTSATQSERTVLLTVCADPCNRAQRYRSCQWWCKHGKTIFAHPLTYSSGMLKTTEKAANYFYRVTSDFDAVVLAHTHKLGMYLQGDVALYEQGTCSDVSQLEYADGNLTMPQQQGFLYLCQDAQGNLILDQTKLVSC